MAGFSTVVVETVATPSRTDDPVSVRAGTFSSIPKVISVAAGVCTRSACRRAANRPTLAGRRQKHPQRLRRSRLRFLLRLLRPLPLRLLPLRRRLLQVRTLVELYAAGCTPQELNF